MQQPPRPPPLRILNMNFYNWMMRNHRDEDTPAGDLAADMEHVKDSFPRNGTGKFDGWHRLIRSYLVQRHACSECLEVFEECWEEYVECEKSRLNRNW